MWQHLGHSAGVFRQNFHFSVRNRYKNPPVKTNSFIEILIKTTLLNVSYNNRVFFLCMKVENFSTTVELNQVSRNIL